VPDTVLPGDLNAGDVIALPDEDGDLVVEAVQLGQGGFLLTVSALDAADSATTRVVTLTAAIPVSRRGRNATAHLRG
jgi:hypothetical protein